MHAVVCIKQVPDTTEVRIDPKTNTLQRQGVPSIINPYDQHALEEALRLKDRHGGRVTVISMGPPQVQGDLKRCIGQGADEAILISDRLFGGADTLATSYVLSLAIRKLAQEHPVDVVFCGKQAIDGDTAQVGPGVAQRLGMQQLTYVINVESVDPEKRLIRVHRHLEGGTEVVEAALPALLTVVKEINVIRYSSLEDMIRAATYRVPVWGVDALQADPGRIGLKGSPTLVRRVFAPPARQGGEVMEGAGADPAAAASRVIDFLFARGLREKVPYLAKGGAKLG